jgi:hypothetical protein
MNSQGSIRQFDDNQWVTQPDYAKALELYRRIVREFAKGETRYFDPAQQQIKTITEPTLGIGVSNIFLPGSEVQFGLNARNLRSVGLAIYKLDLTRDVRFSGSADADEGVVENESWLQKLSTAGKQPFTAWAKSLETAEPHQPTNTQVRIDVSA